MPDVHHPFVEYLEKLREHEDRGALAALRRGLGQPAGSAYEMYRYVVPWLGEQSSPAQEERYFLVAALFAYHPQAGGTGNLGASFARTRTAQGDDTATERRFTALLTAHREDLPFYLRQAISFLRAKDVAVDYHQLLLDLGAWERGYVQRNWAQAFWGRSATPDPAPGAESAAK
jgi:CRISPR system Cascade subunit CasB